MAVVRLAIGVAVRYASCRDFPRIRQSVQIAVGLAAVRYAIGVHVTACTRRDVARIGEPVAVAVWLSFACIALTIAVTIGLRGIGDSRAVVLAVWLTVIVLVGLGTAASADVRGAAITFDGPRFVRAGVSCIRDAIAIVVGGDGDTAAAASSLQNRASRAIS